MQCTPQGSARVLTNYRLEVRQFWALSVAGCYMKAVCFETRILGNGRHTALKSVTCVKSPFEVSDNSVR